MKTKTKTIKKSVDSIVSRRSRRGLVLDIKKIAKKRAVLFRAANIDGEAKKRSVMNYLAGFLRLAKEPARVYSAQSGIMKITAGILIISLNWLGISAIGKTTAYFIDTEISAGNTFSTGTLDFLLTSPTDSFVPQDKCSGSGENDFSSNGNNNGHNNKPDDCDNDEEGDNDDNDDQNQEQSYSSDEGDQENNENDDSDDKKSGRNDQGSDDDENDENGNANSLAREIRIEQEGSMNFQYAPAIRNILGDSDLCDSLVLKAKLAGEIVYSGNIANFDFETSPFVISEEGRDIWNFTIDRSSLGGENGGEHNGENSGNNGNKDKSCQFDFSFRAWQVDLGPEYGFGTEKKIGNIIEFNSGHGDQGSDNDDNTDNNDTNGYHLHLTTSLTADSGSEDNGNFGNSEADKPADSEENSAEIEKNSTDENIPDSGEAPLPAETPLIDPAAEDHGIIGADKSLEKGEKGPKDQGQAEISPTPVP